VRPLGYRVNVKFARRAQREHAIRATLGFECAWL
jgi:hypothetical protein